MDKLCFAVKGRLDYETGVETSGNRRKSRSPIDLKLPYNGSIRFGLYSFLRGGGDYDIIGHYNI